MTRCASRIYLEAEDPGRGETASSRRAPTRHHGEVDGHVAARGVRVGADLLVRLLGEGGELGRGQALVLHLHIDGDAEAAAVARPMDTEHVILALIASSFCFLATKSSAPPKHAA
jgi:hypothetical protein